MNMHTLELVVVILSFLLLIYFYIKYVRVYSGGYTIREAIKELEATTHCGQYWNTKAKVNYRRMEVYVLMESNEYVVIDLKTGKRERLDLD